jgi:hypothetical protein
MRDVTVPVVQLPFDTDSDIAGVYRFIFNHRPLVNGYSGYFPPHYSILLIAMRVRDAEVLREFAIGAPIDFVVDRHRDFERWSAAATALGAHAVADDADWKLYRLDAQPHEPALSGARLPILDVTANFGADLVSRMTDGDGTTVWNTRRGQAGDEQITIDLGQDRYVADIEMVLGVFKSDFPRQITVECADESATWEVCWRGSGARLALRSVLDDPRNPVLRVPLDRRAVRRLRIRQTAADPLNGWSIAELVVHGH